MSGEMRALTLVIRTIGIIVAVFVLMVLLGTLIGSV